MTTVSPPAFSNYRTIPHLFPKTTLVDQSESVNTIGMSKHFSLTNQFLIAMPALADPNFHGTVTYICEHNDQGAMGLVINRPLSLTLGQVLVEIDITTGEQNIGQQAVYMGGPVQTERGFVLHHPLGEWDSMLRINDEIGVTTSKDILENIAKGTGPQRMLVALGYAGWGAGQLEQELADNVWLCGPADNRIIFDLPWQQRWEAAAALMGVDLNQISNQIGHA